MALTDLLQNRFTRVLGTLAALAIPAGLACEADEGSPVFPSGSQSISQPCYSDNECKGERICVSGYCQDSGSNPISPTPNVVSYTCQNACQKLIDCCKIVTGNPQIDCENYENGQIPTTEELNQSLNSCIYGCQFGDPNGDPDDSDNGPWSQSTIDCFGALYCTSPQDPKKCSGNLF